MRGALAALALICTPAMAEQISISGTIVSLEPSPVLGELAIVTMENIALNNQLDNGEYSLSIPEVSVTVEFTWEVGMFGQDQIVVVPPDGVICVPENCTMTPMEGQTGRVVLIDWRGM